jgi:hypothetical protein
MRTIDAVRVISLAIGFGIAERDLLAGELVGSRMPSWFSDADIVLLAERNERKSDDERFSITEIWKASRPLVLSTLPLSVGRLSQKKILILINIPRFDANLGANPKTLMKIREIPISDDDSVTIDSPDGQRQRFNLVDLRVALALEESKK